MERAIKNLTRVTLELSENDVAVICSDADVETVAPQIAMATFLNSGQICIAIKRIYVYSSIYEAFKTCFLKHVSMLRVVGAFQEGIMLGPTQNKRRFGCVKSFLADVRGKQSVLTGGDILSADSKDLFIRPTVVDNPPDDSKIMVEEPFGPVVLPLQWSNTDDVVDLVNATDQGLKLQSGPTTKL